MSEFGQIIDPYRSAPAQGGLLEEILQFAGMTAQLDQQRRLETERMGTNQMINDQKGWSGVDPFKVQQFDQGQQNMQIAGAQEGRAAQDWQQKQEFAKGYVPNAQGMLTGSQFLESLRGLPANPYLAQTIMGALGQRDQMGVEQQSKQQMLQQELQMRQQMNNADNIAETERAKAVAGIQAQSERDRLSDTEAIKLRQMKGATDYLKSNIDDPMLTGGDIAMRFGMNDTSAAMYFNSEIDRLRKAKKAQADAAANAEHVNSSESQAPQNPKLTAQQNAEISQAVVQALQNSPAYRNYTPLQIAQMAVRQSQSFGGYDNYRHVQAVYPNEYAQAWDEFKQAEQQKQFKSEKEKATNPLMYYLGKFLSGTRN